MANTEHTNTLAAETDALFNVIGKVVVRFQQIELWVSEALAVQLGFSTLENRYLFQSAMSFRQKVDLLMELLNRKSGNDLPCSISVAQRALGVAEDFRNGVVHAFWGVNGLGKWERTKPSIKGNRGFVLRSKAADLRYLEKAVEALATVRDWELHDDAKLQAAIDVFSLCHGQA